MTLPGVVKCHDLRELMTPTHDALTAKRLARLSTCKIVMSVMTVMTNMESHMRVRVRACARVRGVKKTHDTHDTHDIYIYRLLSPGKNLTRDVMSKVGSVMTLMTPRAR